MYIENNSDELKFVILMMENYLSELFSEQEYDKNNFFLIAGPCVVEGEGMAHRDLRKDLYLL